MFVSIGTGKRPAGSDQNQHLWYEGFMGDFAEARRRLISKIEGCEETHQYMMREGLSKRGVNIESYFRLNVEIGVGEFGMNEWNRLADISTGTRRYLGKTEVKRINDEAAYKLGKIWRSIQRFNRDSVISASGDYKGLFDVPEAYPTAVELPAEVPPPTHASHSPSPRPSYESGHHDTLEVPSQKHHHPSPRSSAEKQSRHSPKTSSGNVSGPDGDRLIVHSPTPSQYRNASGADKIAIVNSGDMPRPAAPTAPPPKVPTGRIEPPPLPPKTPILDQGAMGRGRPPYPDFDGPPPAVNMARKPRYNGN